MRSNYCTVSRAEFILLPVKNMQSLFTFNHACEHAETLSLF
jgi:hypothetical protein